MKLESNIDDMVKRKVRDANTSGRVNVPKTWLDKYVVVCLLDEEQQKKAMKMERQQPILDSKRIEEGAVDQEA